MCKENRFHQDDRKAFKFCHFQYFSSIDWMNNYGNYFGNCLSISNLFFVDLFLIQSVCMSIQFYFNNISNQFYKFIWVKTMCLSIGMQNAMNCNWYSMLRKWKRNFIEFKHLKLATQNNNNKRSHFIE